MNKEDAIFEIKIGTYETNSKYSNYTKQGSSDGSNNTLKELINIQQQNNKSKKEGE